MSYLVIGIWLAIALSIVCLLAWEIIYTKGFWYMKVLSSTAVVFLIFFSIYSWRSIQGSPKFVKNPDSLVVRSYMIKEPQGSFKGKIWLWITDPKDSSEPINIEIPYTTQTHKNLMENKGFSEGRAQVIRSNRDENFSQSDRQFVFEDVIKHREKVPNN